LADTCQRVAERFGIELDPTAIVGELAVGQQQRVEIARLLHRGVRILILDEPTAVLTPQETLRLFENLRELATAQHSIVIVTHKLDEVLAVADTVSVMRNGRVVAGGPAAAYTATSLAHEMVGRGLESIVVAPQAAADAWSTSHDAERSDVLRVEHLTVAGRSGSNAVDDVSFSLAAGEILGVCGVAGNGQRELAEALAGMRAVRSGSVRLHDRDVTHESVATRVDLGISYVPEDRLATGVAPGLPVEDNLLLRSYRDETLRRGPLLLPRAANAAARSLIEEYDIRGVRPGLPASALSGGNIQRLIFAREISRHPSVVIAASPTRGLDVGATMTARRVLGDARTAGLAVLLISEDLDELVAMSDRLVVMYRGRLVGAFARAEASVEILGELMAGVGARAIAG
jgi:simple sugar transport system ATP-binding protein